MIINNCRLAFRNLWNHKGFTAINITGLSLGLATCMLIMMYVLDELSYDRFHSKADRIFRIDADIQFGGNHMVMAVAPDPMGPTLKHDYPQVEQFVRMRYYKSFLIRKGHENISESRVVFADSTLFSVFTLPMLAGDPHTALITPKSIVITESMAKKYFNTLANVVGQDLTLDDTFTCRITGIIKDIPTQSHFDFQFYISLSSAPESRGNIWINNNFYTYILLKQPADAPFIAAQLPLVVNKYLGGQVKQEMNLSIEDFQRHGNHVQYDLTPLTDIHLHSNKQLEICANGNIRYVYIFSTIALFILLVACVNFMNLSTARSSTRIKEVGVRKVLGSLRGKLVLLFLTESILLCFFSALFASTIVYSLVPYFNQLAGKTISVQFLSGTWLVPILILSALVVGLLAGSYPAFFLSAFRPAQVLKGSFSSAYKKSWLRSSLVVFQFFISIFLIIGTIVIYRQLNYIRHKDLGYDRKQVLIIRNTDALGSGVLAFKSILLRLPGVEQATMTGYLPTSSSRNDSPLFLDGSMDPKRAVSSQIWSVDDQYIPTLGMTVLQGRNFTSSFPTDSSGVIINEAAASLMGAGNLLNGSGGLLNRTVYLLSTLHAHDAVPLHILGVVKNFHFTSLREVVTPLALVLQPQAGCISLRITTHNVPLLIDAIRAAWREQTSSQPFNYSFMDEDFDRSYRAEQRVGQIFVSFAILAIIIACLGLLGLVMYAAEQRTKEIGIRKVLGAGVPSIVTLLSVDLLKLVVLAALIAFPVAGWAMNKWLRDFAYHVTVTWWTFAIAALTAIVVALITISFQTLRAAGANPARVLRAE